MKKKNNSKSDLESELDEKEEEEEEGDDYDEPNWDETALQVIEEIEAKYINEQKNKLIINTTTTTREHLQIQLEQDIGKKNPTECSIRHHHSHDYHVSLYHRFAALYPNLRNSNSLYSRFRSTRNFVSVWCQVQVEYGLLGKRYLKPSQRPTSFISSSGVEIKVNTNLVLSRQKILDGGTRVHAKLEKEVAPEHVRVQVVTQVDTWGLKVINTIVNLCLLRSTRMMREIHVWGFIGGFLIQGIIDQIDLIPDPSMGDDRAASSAASPIISLTKNNHTDTSKRLLARISDSKTTQSPTLPPPEHTESARYQLMLYKYLHDQNASGRFDLERFGVHLGIDLDETFSEFFLKDIEPLLRTIGESLQENNNEQEEEKFSSPKTLRSMFRLYDRLIKLVGVSDETLEIVYRKRGRRQNLSADVSNRKKLKRTHHPPPLHINLLQTPTTTAPIDSVPHLDSSANQIELSSNSDSINPTSQHNESKESNPKSQADTRLIENSEKLKSGSDGILPSSDSNSSIQKETNTIEIKNEENHKKAPSSSSSSSSSLIDQKKKNEKDFLKFSSVDKMRALNLDSNNKNNKNIIGSFEFEFHPIEFSKFIFDALRFWNGDQDPVGVTIEESNKCESCEFKDGCEWRSKISNQILDSI